MSLIQPVTKANIRGFDSITKPLSVGGKLAFQQNYFMAKIIAMYLVYTP